MIRVATASVNQTPLDWTGNRNRIIAASQAAMQCNPDAILFPELCISGYGCEDAFHMPELWQNAAESLQLLAEKLNGVSGSVPVIVGLPYVHLGLLYNVSAVLSNGELVALVPKQHLAGDGIHYEPRWFHPYRGAPEPAAEGVLFGPSIIDTGNFRFIIEICEDSWVDNRPASQHAGSSFDCILSPTASHFAIGKERIRRQIALETSRAFHCTYISVNLLGNEAGRAIYDGQSIAAQTGNLLYESPSFSFNQFTVHCISFDPEPNRSRRVQTHSFRESITVPSHSSLESATVRISESRKDFGFRIPGEETTAPRKEKEIPLPTDYCGPLANPAHSPSSPGRSDNRPMEKRHGEPNLEFLYAASLGLFDYLRKSHSRGFALSLSGGADSAVCALLVTRMIRFGLTELGKEKFLESIHRTDLEHLPEEEVVRNLLFTVYQGTDQSSEITRNAASTLAEALGTNHQSISVQSLVSNYIETYEGAYGRKLTWKSDDLVLQNIQARARSPFVWMLANATGSLLIATGNRSEGAVGYCTMDGDTSGGIAPIAGIDKDFLRKWLLYMESVGDPHFGPEPSLRAINAQQPTAELRPAESHQTDESDLMAYDLLNRIQKLAVRDRMGPRQILKQLLIDNELESVPDSKESTNGQAWSSHAGGLRQRLFSLRYDRSQLAESIRKFFRLWSRNQWKRERIAVSFHLDDENIDPRTYFRFPILSAGFEEELESLLDAP